MATTYVSTFAELKTAVEDATTTDITVTANITFSTGGIRVNVAKNNLVIDFGGFTVTDTPTNSFTDTIYIASTTNTINVTAKNATWNGRNYYGVIGVYDGNTNSTINLENINYTGPQFVYNKYGTTNIKNCTVTIDKGSSSTNPQEFCEANRLTISGKVNVISNSTSNAVVWFTATGASLTVEENATFEVSAPSTYFLYTDIAPVMLFKDNSYTTISTKGGLFYTTGSSHIASSFTVNQGASFVATKLTASSVPMFKCQSNLTVQPNAVFKLINPNSSTASLMYFSQVANINFTQPKNVVLYNNGGNIFSFQTGSTTNQNTLKITTEMLRLWNTATTPYTSAGGIDDVPTTQFYKANYSSNLTANIGLSNSQVLSVESNIETGDTGYPLTTASLDLLNRKVISFGAVTLNTNEISDISTAITGTADPNANMRATYNSNTLNGTANSTGTFSLTLADKLTVGSTVNMLANPPFLLKSQAIEVVGSVSITKLDELKFYAFNTTPNKSQIYRQNSNWAMQVTDTRTSGGSWYVYAHINAPLTHDTSTLKDAIVFKTGSSAKPLSATPVLVYTGTWDSTNKTTNITWSKEEGFLLNIDPSATFLKGNYSTNIIWQITTTPLTE